MYRDLWLYALSIHWNVEVDGLSLSDRASEAAFVLAGLLAEEADDHVQDRENPQEEPTEEEEHSFPWDEKLEDVPQALLVLYTEALAGARKLDLKVALEGLPRFKGVAWRAPENNFRQDSRHPLDGTVKNWSQWVLHGLRYQVTAYKLLLEGQQPERRQPRRRSQRNRAEGS